MPYFTTMLVLEIEKYLFAKLQTESNYMIYHYVEPDALSKTLFTSIFD
jgi:hypothetical protein